MESIWKREERTIRARGDRWRQRNTVFQTQHFWGMHEFTVTVVEDTAYTSSCKIGSNNDRTKRTWVFTPNQKSIDNTLWQRKLSFPKWVIILSTIKGVYFSVLWGNMKLSRKGCRWESGMRLESRKTCSIYSMTFFIKVSHWKSIQETVEKEHFV